MSISWIAALTCISYLAVAGDSPETPTNLQLCHAVASNLLAEVKNGPIPRRDLEIQAFRGTITITGRIESADEAVLILNAIKSIEGTRGIRLNLGIVRQPTPLRPDTLDFSNWPMELKE